MLHHHHNDDVYLGMGFIRVRDCVTSQFIWKYKPLKAMVCLLASVYNALKSPKLDDHGSHPRISPFAIIFVISFYSY